MKIVEVIPSFRIRAGAEVFVFNLAQEFVKEPDVELTIISLWDDFDESFSTLKKCKNINLFFCHKTKGPSIRAAKLFKEIIKKTNPDIIHMHLSCLPTYFLAFGLRKKQWKIAYTYHSVANKESRNLVKILHKMYLRRNYFYQIGISDLVSNSIMKVYKNSNVFTIYNGILLKEYCRAAEKKYDLICVGRFEIVKNHEFLLKLIKRFSDNDIKINLICLGNGPLLKDIKSRAKELGIAESVDFIGQVPDVYPYLCQSKIFILPSLWEGNPISILEAMNCGLSVIASKVGGIADIIKDDINGYLLNVNDIDGFYDKIVKVIENKELYEKICKNNIKDVQKYSIKTCAEQYLVYFKEIISK